MWTCGHRTSAWPPRVDSIILIRRFQVSTWRTSQDRTPEGFRGADILETAEIADTHASGDPRVLYNVMIRADA